MFSGLNRLKLFIATRPFLLIIFPSAGKVMVFNRYVRVAFYTLILLYSNTIAPFLTQAHLILEDF